MTRFTFAAFALFLVLQGSRLWAFAGSRSDISDIHPPTLLVWVAQPITYRVKRGDTLGKISTRFRVIIEDIQDANPKLAKRKNHTLIKRGEVIIVPRYSLYKNSLMMSEITSGESRGLKFFVPLDESQKVQAKIEEQREELEKLRKSVALKDEAIKAFAAIIVVLLIVSAVLAFVPSTRRQAKLNE